ncbi:hypothetical protein Ancab_004562 [Ancistrocladus abbreviatus]
MVGRIAFSPIVIPALHRDITEDSTATTLEEDSISIKIVVFGHVWDHLRYTFYIRRKMGWVGFLSYFGSVPRGFEAPRFLRRQLMEESEQALQLERRLLLELQLGQKAVSSHPNLRCATDQLNAIEGYTTSLMS